MAGLLTAFLQESAGKPFVWGERDCALWVCDWVARVRGIDPGAHVRGTYSTARECIEMMERAGGLRMMSDDLALYAGLARTKSPELGDIGCVHVSGRDTIGIKTQRGWVFKTICGVASYPGLLVAAWKVV